MHHATTRGSLPARRGLRPRALGLCLLALCLTTFARPAAAADAEPRVARVAYVEGQTSYLNADADEWSAVDVNAPLVTGDRFWSGNDGRAEIQLPGGVYARLASDTELELLEVSDQAVQVKVGVGTATFRLREVPAGQHVEFSTPTTALVARSRGTYRVDVAEDGQTTVTVRDGEADAYLGDDRYRLERGRGARIVDASYVTDDVPPFEVFDATQVPNDPWDDWEAQRAARLQNASSYRYVDADVYGAEDLDDYGTWDRHETYGPIWRPTQVAVGWTPFTQGRWVWQDPWGWTWVDYQPWGWAPSHYGRWVQVQDAWAWAPGPVVARPAYAPATVGFLGVSVNTPSVSVSVGIGPSVGWVPLGWGEPVIPWWGGVYGARRGRPWWGGWGGPRIVNNTVVKNINNVNITNINYNNVDRGFTAVTRDSFVRGDMQRIDVPRERRRDAFRPLRGAPDVIPARDSLFAARPEKLRGERGAKPPQAVLQRAGVSTRDVPAARPGFDRKLKLIERDKGAPVAPQQLRQLARENARPEAASPRVRTMASAKGRKAVVPEVTAQAPQRLNAPLERAARPGGSPDPRAARRAAADAGQPREALQRQDGPQRDAARTKDESRRDAAPGERRMTLPGGDAATRADDPRRATREPRADDQRQRVERAQQERQQREQMRAGRTQPGDAAATRALPDAQQPRAAHDPAREQRQMERTQQGRDRAQARPERPQREQAPTGRPQREQAAQRGDAQRLQAERASREQAQTRPSEQTRRDGLQREQAKRAQQDNLQREQARQAQREQQAGRAQQENARRQQAEQARPEGAQRQQADRARRDAQARQQAGAERARRDDEARQRQADSQRQRESVQAEREQASRQAAQREQASRQAAQREQASRQAAQREQMKRQQGQRQQAERQQAQRQRQQPPAVERQGQAAPQSEDPRRAERREKKQQQRRALPEGG